MSGKPVPDEAEGSGAPEDTQPVSQSPAFVQQAMAMFASGQVSDPVLSKLNDNHIDKAIDNSHEIEKEDFKFRRSSRWFHLAFVGVGVGVFVFLAVFLNSVGQWDTFVEIVKGLVIFAGGAGAGYGVGRRRSSD